MKTQKEIISDIDIIIGKNSEVTDDTHMDLVDQIFEYIEREFLNGDIRESGEKIYCSKCGKWMPLINKSDNIDTCIDCS